MAESFFQSMVPGIKLSAEKMGDLHTPKMVPAGNYFEQIFLGEITGRSIVTGLFKKDDLGGAGFSDLWEAGSDLVYLTTPQKLNISSTSPSDINGGSGAWSVRIIGTNSIGVTLIEDIVLDGTNVVQTNGSFLRINRMLITNAGSGLTNAGDISAIPVLGGIQGFIKAGQSVMFSGNYTVPSDKQLFVTGLTISSPDSDKAFFKFDVITTIDQTRIKINSFEIALSGSLNSLINDVPFLLGPNDDFRLQGSRDGGGQPVEVSGAISFLLADIE